MRAEALWRALREQLAGAGRPSVTLQHLGFSEADAAALQPMLEQLGEQLALTLKLQGNAGEIVLVDQDFAARTPPQLLRSFNEDRPVVLVPGSLGGRQAALQSAAELLESRQQEVLRQLQRIPVVRKRSSNWNRESGWMPPRDMGAGSSLMPFGDEPEGPGFDSRFDSTLDADQLAAAELDSARRQMLELVLRGMDDPGAPALCASYGPAANIRFDFRARLVTCDTLAAQYLRIDRELPLPALPARPQPDYIVRELDQMVWDLGLAAQAHAMRGAPADWWHAPLRLADGDIGITRYSRQPRHVELARRLGAGPATPSQLRRELRAGVEELRGFVQAGLMVGLLHWA